MGRPAQYEGDSDHVMGKDEGDNVMGIGKEHVMGGNWEQGVGG